MALSKQSAASLALYLSIEMPGVFDTFVSGLPGAHAVGLGFFGDDSDLDFDPADDASPDSDFENEDGSLMELDDPGAPTTDDDAQSMENLRELGVGDDTYSTPVPGSAADTGYLGPVPGSSADTTSQVNIDPLTGTLNANDASLALAPTDIDAITPVVQSISSSHAVASIGAPAVGAAASALTSPSGLNALSNAATAYFNSQALAGEEQTQLQQQANNLEAQMQLAQIEHGATATTYATNPQTGAQEQVLANGSTGAPLVDANGNYIPATTGAGILSALTSGGTLTPILILGGVGILLLLLFGGGHNSGGSAPEAPRRSRPRFIEVG